MLKIGQGPVQRKREKALMREKCWSQWSHGEAVKLGMRCASLKVHNCAKQVSLLLSHSLVSLSSHADGPPAFTEQEREAARGWWRVVVGGCLYGKRLWPAWQLCLMDGPPPSGCSACNKYPCSCLTSLTYQTHLSLLGHPRGTHNYALHSPLARVWGIAALFMGRSPRAKSQKNR